MTRSALSLAAPSARRTRALRRAITATPFKRAMPLRKRIAQLQEGVYDPYRGGDDGAACAAAAARWGGFWGPFEP